MTDIAILRATAKGNREKRRGPETELYRHYKASLCRDIP